MRSRLSRTSPAPRQSRWARIETIVRVQARLRRRQEELHRRAFKPMARARSRAARLRDGAILRASPLVRTKDSPVIWMRKPLGRGGFRSDSVAPCSRPSRPLRTAFGGSLLLVLTAAARGALARLGRGEGTDTLQRRFVRICRLYLPRKWLAFQIL